MKNKFFIVTVDGFFGQSIPTEKSLDTAVMSQELRAAGHEATIVDIEEVANGALEPEAIYIFGSHQNSDIKKFIDDIVSLRFLHQPHRCFPPPQYILAHENKGIQAMIAKEIGLDLGNQTYHYRSDDPIDTRLVGKLVDGAGSNGVFIAESGEPLRPKLLRAGKHQLRLADLNYYLKGIIKRAIRHKLYTQDFINYNRRYWRHVRQEVLGNPGHDYKVLVFHDRFFVLRREARPNDFRSSGSGLFSFVEPPAGLLETAREVHEKLGVPCVSLDLIASGGSFKCIEFQCVHFGPYTQTHAPRVFIKNGYGFMSADNFGSTEQHLIHAYVSTLAPFPKVAKTDRSNNPTM